MNKQKVSWRDTWKIYWYHYMEVNMYTSFFIAIIFTPIWGIAYLVHYPLWQTLKQPQYGVPLVMFMFLFQLFPINVYVLRNKTLNAKFKGFRLKLEKTPEENT